MREIPVLEHIRCLRCSKCGIEYEQNEVRYTCPACGKLHGLLDVIYDFERIRKTFSREALTFNRDYTIWRYAPLLPVGPLSVRPGLSIGWTPLYEVPALRDELGMPELYIKDDTRNPSASYKDRASAIAVVKAFELGERLITAASTGNAASSLACLSASLGLKNVIFVPKTAPRPKLAQLAIFGAHVLAVDGNYDAAFELCLEATERFGWYNRNTGFNPYMLEGKKTGALEICEQLSFEPPDAVLVSVGDGCIYAGLFKGFKDFFEMGFIDRIPRMYGIQSEKSAAYVQAFEGDGVVRPFPASTIADSISVEMPRVQTQALRAARESGGAFIKVSDEEIIQAMKFLGRKAGIFAEPAGAASFAGVRKLLEKNLIKKDEKVVVVITGSGLKDIDTAIKAAEAPRVIKPDLDEVSRWVDDFLC